MFADITGQNGLFLNVLDMASHYQVVFPVADKNPLTVFYDFSLVGVSRLVFQMSFNRPSSVNWLSKLNVGFLPAASVSPTQNAPCECA